MPTERCRDADFLFLVKLYSDVQDTIKNLAFHVVTHTYLQRVALFNGYILDVVPVLEDAHPVALYTTVGVEESACNSIALRG